MTASGPGGPYPPPEQVTHPPVEAAGPAAADGGKQTVGDGARLWRDPAPLRTDWPAPVRVRLRRVVLIIVAVLVLAIVAVAAAGGFGERDDGRINVGPGVLFESGPYQLSFDSAVAWPNEFDGEIDSWNVRVRGYGRITDTTSMAPPYRSLLVADRTGGIVEDGNSYRIGSFTDFGVQFQPGMPMLPYEVSADFPAEYEPDTELQIGVAQVVRENRSASGDTSGLVWSISDQVYVVRVPLTILEEEPPA